MIQKIHKRIISALFLSMLLGFAIIPAHEVKGQEIDLINDATQVNSFSGFEVGKVANDPRIIIKRIINIVMGFLGMLAVLVILFGGFKWMTAGGNKEQVEKAQQLLVNGVIGLIVIFSAWTVAWYTVNIIRLNVRRVV